MVKSLLHEYEEEHQIEEELDEFLSWNKHKKRRRRRRSKNNMYEEDIDNDALDRVLIRTLESILEADDTDARQASFSNQDDEDDYWSMLYNDDESPRSPESTQQGAALAGAVAGVLLSGPALGVVAAGTLAWAATHEEGALGDLARTGGALVSEWLPKDRFSSKNSKH